jgi:3-hydroxyisobutyrate dehydrogenase-like beta-hydroxyacid dehydrogenase
MRPDRPTIAILYPGEMGAALAAALRDRRPRLITTLAHRSAITAKRCRDQGIEVLDSLGDVVRAADIVFSVVPPAVAHDVALAYARLADVAPEDSLYVDVNSIGPDSIESISRNIGKTGRGFVDAAINGLAKNLTTSGTLFLSGQRAGEIGSLFEGLVRIRIVGAEPGRASMMKMLLAGMSKGLCALFVELAAMAKRRDMLDEMLSEAARIYPGMTTVIDRMLPTYAQHAARRASEMNELQQTAQFSGIEPRVIAAMTRLHEEIARISFDTPDGSSWTVASLIGRLLDEGIVTFAACEVVGKFKE